MKKKFLAVLLACAMAMGTVVSPIGVETVKAGTKDESITENGIKYQEVGNEIYISGYTGNATEIIIPDTIEGKSVTCIWEFAFAYQLITSVNIPESVTSIAGYAFDA